MTEDPTLHRKPSVPSHSGTNAEEVAADVLATVQDAAAQEVASAAAKMVIVTVNTKDAATEQVDVVREYADLPDEVYYPTINAGVKIKAGDQVAAIERPGGMIILGKAWKPGDPDLDSVRVGTSITDNAIINRHIAVGSVKGEQIAQNSIRNSELAVDSVAGENIKNGTIGDGKLANNYAAGGHGHKQSDNNMDGFAGGGHGHGGHKHGYIFYDGKGQRSTGSTDTTNVT